MTNRATIDIGAARKPSGTTVALAGADLHADAAQVLLLPGADDAGMATLARILTTLLKPDARHARAAGFDVVRDAAPAGPVIGLIGQAAVGELLAGRENLELAGRLYHLPKAGHATRAGARRRCCNEAAS